MGRIDFKDPSLSLPTSEITGANNKTHSIKSGFIVHGITSGNLTGSMCFFAYSKLMCKKAVYIYIFTSSQIIHISTWNNLTFSWFHYVSLVFMPSPRKSCFRDLPTTGYQDVWTTLWCWGATKNSHRKILWSNSNRTISHTSHLLAMMGFSTRKISLICYKILFVFRVFLPGCRLWEAYSPKMMPVCVEKNIGTSKFPAGNRWFHKGS